MGATQIYDFQYDIGLYGIEVANDEESYYDSIFDLDRETLENYGHMEYILILYETGELPDTNSYELYHPPLNYMILAGFLHVMDLFNLSSQFKIEALEFVPVVYSVIILWICYRIMREIGFSKKQTIIPFSLLTFGSIFIYMSKMINNDELCTLFSIASVLFLIKWNKEPSYKNTIWLALMIGLGGMTKTSILVMALPLIFVYIKKIYVIHKDKKMLKKVIIEGIIFSLITLPLILWYPIRNYIKFGQVPFSVLEASETLAVSSTSFVSRWILNSEIFDNLLILSASNVWAYVINSSIYFVMAYNVFPVSVSMVFKVISIILIIISLVGMIKYSILTIIKAANGKNDENGDSIYILTITYLAWMIGFISVNISLPYSCTMHLRYILVPMMIGIIYIGMLYNNAKHKNTKTVINGLTVLYNVISVAIIIYASTYYAVTYTVTF